MKSFIITLFVFSAFLSNVRGQDNPFAIKNKFEINLEIPLQRAFFVNSSLSDISLPKQQRYNAGINIGIRYYVFEKWFTEYKIGFSPEGGGFSNQFTKANYVKNSIRLGFSTSHSGKIIFSIYTGLDINSLLSANFVNLQFGQNENVGSYFNNTTFGLPLGIDFKTKVGNSLYGSMGTYMVLGLSDVNKTFLPKELQFILPAFNLKISKIIQ